MGGTTWAASAISAVRGLALGDLGMGLRVVIWGGAAFGFQTASQVADGVMSFGMDHDQGPLAPRHLEHVKKLGIVQDKIVIGHEHLERGEPILHQRGQFLTQHLRRRIADDQMKSHVGMAIALRLAAVILDAGAQRLTLDLQRKGQHRRIAPCRSRARAACEIIRHRRAIRGRLVQMHMRVDPARQDQKTGGVDALGRRKPGSDLGDATVLDADIGGIAVGCGDDGAAGDDKIQTAHAHAASRATICASASVRRSTCSSVL